MNGIFSGQAEKICGSWIKPGAVVIDCGINAIDDSTKKAGANIIFTILLIYYIVFFMSKCYIFFKGYRLVGDVNFQEASKVAGYITPVPGKKFQKSSGAIQKNLVK